MEPIERDLLARLLGPTPAPDKVSEPVMVPMFDIGVAKVVTKSHHRIEVTIDGGRREMARHDTDKPCEFMADHENLEVGE